MQTGKIVNIQHFSTEDGPGIRTTVFMKGCPLRCLWCSNPETQSGEKQLAYRESLCVRCGKCISGCPGGALRAQPDEKSFISIDRALCASCGSCAEECPANALFFYGEERSADEVWEEVERDAGYYLQSGGGLTVSGGEAMSQPDFAAELFRRCRRAGIHTALDTCGFFPPAALDKTDGLIDLVLYDLKLMDDGLHRKYTGAGNKLILQNARRIADMGIKMIARIPLIPGVNDTDENLEATARFAKELTSLIEVDLLPYHIYGRNKYRMLGMPYLMREHEKQSEEHLEHCREIFLKQGLDCAVR